MLKLLASQFEWRLEENVRRTKYRPGLAPHRSRNNDVIGRNKRVH
jgi:type II secretory pathway component PulJ